MKNNILLFLAVVLSAVSCKEKEQKVYGPRPIKVQKVEKLEAIEKIYSGIVAPDQFSSLAFKVSGPLVALYVDNGVSVKKGQRIAQIDKQDFLLDFGAKQASYNTAKAQLERSKKLLTKEAISRQEYESNLASYYNAKAAFDHAKNSLEDTELKAPFDGFVQTKYVENYQKIQAGQSIVTLVNPNKLMVNMVIPESHLQYFNYKHEFFVEFDSYRGKYFKAVIKDYVQSSLDGSGLPVSLYIEDEDFNLTDFNIAIGFSCDVKLKVYDNELASLSVVPLSSIAVDEATGNLNVFIFNDATQTVRKVAVTQTGFVGKDKIQVAGQLSSSDDVVIAGVKRLVDGQKVKLLAQ